ncbi:unnamed protein product [Amoebophrya sp. A120]|nr:unnamed protein product [Amoebophrya sp. A120]|eukprot:GSA120T00000502001.1
MTGVDENGLAIQDLAKLDVTTLTPLSREVIARQATINVGTIGHVAHGKSTVVKALTGLSTIRHKSEKERNITIKLGYANAKLYKTDDVEDPAYQYCSMGSAQPDEWKGTLNIGEAEDREVTWKLQRHISFVDCPGHDILMATMLNGAAVMDAALLLVSSNEPCPQPQTLEHLAAVEIMKLKHIIILQNKVELIKAEAARAQHKDIKEFVEGTVAEDAPIIPISAVLKYNMDLVAQYLCTQIPIPPRDFQSVPSMIVIRSFDVNKPGEEIEKLKGGVAGGSILRGVLKMHQEIEFRPGVITKTKDGPVCKPLKSHVTRLQSENNELQYAVPGGLIAVGTKLDPTLTRADHLLGNMLGVPGNMPQIFVEVEIKYYLLKRLLGVKVKEGESNKVKKLSTGEILMVNVGSTAVGGRILGMKDSKKAEDKKDAVDKAKIELTNPVCAQPGDKVALSRRIEKHWRLVGWGTILKGSTLKVE